MRTEFARREAAASCFFPFRTKSSSDKIEAHLLKCIWRIYEDIESFMLFCYIEAKSKHPKRMSKLVR